MTRLVGWATLVGGALSGAVAGLLLLGPMLGFYPLGAHSPGPRTTGAVELPAALVQRTAQQPARPAPARSPVGAATIGVRSLAVAPASAPAVRAPRVGLGNRPVSVDSGPPAPVVTPQPAAGTPVVAAPVVSAPAAPAPVVSEPVAATPAAAAPVVAQRPVTTTFTASSVTDEQTSQHAAREQTSHDAAREQRHASHDALKAALQTARAEIPAPEAATGQDDGAENEQKSHAWERDGSDDDHADDQDRGHGHATHDGEHSED